MIDRCGNRAGVSIISFMLSMKVDLSEISSFSFNNVSWPKLLIILKIGRAHV